jgi:DNA-directed RNA polymerase I, II, and III subunit RPABC5
MVIGNKYRFYLQSVRKKKLSKNGMDESQDIDKVIYLTNEHKDKTAEGEVLDELGMYKMCCRRHFLTHVDIE